VTRSPRSRPAPSGPQYPPADELQAFKRELEDITRDTEVSLWLHSRRLDPEAWETLPDVSFEKALLHPADGISVVPMGGDWADLGDWQAVWRAAARGHWPLFWVDAIALAMAFGFARLAVASQRRARNGDPNSVWAN